MWSSAGGVSSGVAFDTAKFVSTMSVPASMFPMAAGVDETSLRAGIIAHTIRLRKCPKPGTTIVFSYQVQSVDASAALEGDFSNVVDVTEKKKSVGFTVTVDDIVNAWRLLDRAMEVKALIKEQSLR